jgi:hypothetical protein
MPGDSVQSSQEGEIEYLARARVTSVHCQQAVGLDLVEQAGSRDDAANAGIEVLGDAGNEPEAAKSCPLLFGSESSESIK